MDFKEASTALTECTTLAEIAAETGLSEATVRRARLDRDSPAYRSPPANWKEAIVRLAEERIRRLRALIDALR
jgi:predicted transcriptional regulator